jgi:hypothetical protein
VYAVLLRITGAMTAAIQRNAAPADVVLALQALPTLTTGTSVYGAIAVGAIAATSTQLTVCHATQVSHFAATAFQRFL